MVLWEGILREMRIFICFVRLKEITSRQ